MTIKGARGGPSQGHPEFELAARAGSGGARQKNVSGSSGADQAKTCNFQSCVRCVAISRNPKVQVEWQEQEAMWVVAGGKLEEPIAVSTVEIRERFPIFLLAAEEYVKSQTSPLSEDDMEALLGCAASSLAEIVPSRQRFAVYRSVAFFLGYKERIELPDGLEEAIKQTWAEPGEQFVGYREAE
ncbi:hypothetical protein R1sor_003478 [Riccia sorocarpa]|uniref:Uncharacterized protein n=1 Tax=Riccia sorocarpa TaxID=122646 RepID=A0ABD3H3V2_9MARC